MMTVQMDKVPTPSWETAQRLYDKNIELENKRRKSAQARVPSDPNAWQQMRENYESIILEDYTFSEQHNIEYALWQLHYRRIEEFRAHLSAALSSMNSATSQGGKGPPRPDRISKIRIQFKTFLSEATGFYHDLILKIKAKYGLPLGYFANDSKNQNVLEDGGQSIEMKKGSLSCHRCLIYLGDLSRYKGLYGEGDSKTRDYAAASSYYLEASSLWPSSGNPHHQLAILATYSGDELVSVYRYFRSLAADNPFPTARDNLIVSFEKNRQFYYQLHENTGRTAVKESSARGAKRRGKGEVRFMEPNSDASPAVEGATSICEKFKAFCIRFVRLNGILFTRTSLETFEEVLSLVSSGLCELLSSGPDEELNFGSDATENGLVIVRVISILIFTIYNVIKDGEGKSYSDIVQRTVLLQKAFIAAFELMGNIMMRCDQLHNPSSSYLLPGILVFMEWLASCPDVASGNNMDDRQANARSDFWVHCISFLNKILSSGLISMDDEDETCFFNMSRYDEGESENRLPLWEDFELRGFLPLQPAQSILDFSRNHTFRGDDSKAKAARVKRIVAAGKALANIVRVGQNSINFSSNLKKFVIGGESQMSKDVLLSPKSNGGIDEVLADSMKEQLYVEGEEEDEVIVFKPIITKREDLIASQWNFHEGMEPSQNAPVSAPENNLYQQIAIDSGSKPHSSSATWVEQQTSLFNGLKDLSLSEDTRTMKKKPVMQEDIGVPYTSHLSFPTQQSINLNTSAISRSQAYTSMQPMVDSNASSAWVNPITSSVKTSSALPPSSKRSPVNRPVRHLGPPPGFGHVPPKQVNETSIVSDFLVENPLMDDYSWLDGYQLPPSAKSLGLNQFMNQQSHSGSQYMTNGNGYEGAVSFPFPGKQVYPIQSEVEKQRGWQNNEIVGNINIHYGQVQQQEVMKGSQQQSLWAGRHVV